MFGQSTSICKFYKTSGPGFRVVRLLVVNAFVVPRSFLET